MQKTPENWASGLLTRLKASRVSDEYLTQLQVGT